MRALSRLRDGLVGAWCPSIGGWGGNVLRDLSGQGNHGTLTNMDPATDWVVSGGKQALDFDGVDDTVTITQYPGAFGPGDFAFALWYRPFNATQTYRIAGSRNSQDEGFFLFQQSSLYRFLTDDGPSGAQNVQSTSTVTTSWAHLVGQRIAGSVRLFVNGIEEGTPHTNTANLRSSAPLELGSVFATAFFQGQLDDIRIYNRALSASEIRTLYNGGPGFGLRPERTRRHIDSLVRRRNHLLIGNIF